MNEPAFETALAALVTEASQEFKPGWTDPEGFEYGMEKKSRALLEQLLTGPVLIQRLLGRLAELRHPKVGLFTRQLQERLGGAALTAETLAAVRRGLLHKDELVSANALSVAVCAPAQLPALEGEIIALLRHVEATTRALAANTLNAFPHLSPASMEALKSLSLRHAKYPDGRAARDALLQRGAPVFLPQGGVLAQKALRWALPLPVLSQDPAFLGEDGALYFAFDHVSTLSPPTPEQGWGPWAGTSGLARLRLTAEGPRVELFPLPVGTGLEFKLAARLGRELLCVLSRPLSVRREVDTAHSFLLFDPATDSWSQALPEDGLPGPRRIPFEASGDSHPLLDISRAHVGAGRHLVWTDPRGQLRCHGDDTRYSTVDYRTSDEVREASTKRYEALELATRHHRLEVMPSRADAEPWCLLIPALREGVHWQWDFYGIRRLIFEYHPRLRQEDVSATSCLSAHQLVDASGREHLVLFAQAWLNDLPRREQCLLVLAAGEEPKPPPDVTLDLV